MIKPVYTEKSLNMSKNGKYTFWVSASDTKTALKSEIAKIFGVTVTDIKTLNNKGEKGRNARGRKFVKKGAKKAIVTLKEGDKIDIYEKA